MHGFQICNHVDWQEIKSWFNKHDASQVAAGIYLDNHHRIVCPQWMTGPHAMACCVYLLANYRAKGVSVLDLRGVYLPILPDCMDKFIDLKRLYLHNNQLRSLPLSIGNIPQLTLLSLGRNGIGQLPKTIINRRYTLQKLFLGNNAISALPFAEQEMVFLNQGSIGENPLPEPVGVRWMLRKDAQQAAINLLSLFQSSGPKSQMLVFIEQGINLILTIDEPMVWEFLFKQVVIQPDGRIIWNTFFPEQTWVRYAALKLLPLIHKAAMVDNSLWAHNIRQLNLETEPLIEVPDELKHLPVLEKCILPKGLA